MLSKIKQTALQLGIAIFAAMAGAQTSVQNPTNSSSISSLQPSTNEFRCSLRIVRDEPWVGLPPVCVVNIVATRTTTNQMCWRNFSTNYLEIDLSNADGKPVERTAWGENYRHFSTPLQVEDAFRKNYRKARRLTVQGFTSTPHFDPSLPETDFTSLSIPALFNITQPGEYKLSVRMRLLERDRKAFDSCKFTIIPLPEVVTNVHILPTDIITNRP